MKNIKKASFKKCLPLIIMFVYFIIGSPFISNNYSFMFLKTVKYWVSIVPMLIIFPFAFYVTIEENKNSIEK